MSMVSRITFRAILVFGLLALALPTGSTPVGVYQELVRMHREESLDFSHVVAFVLNEFYGVHPDQLQSHHRWIKEHLWGPDDEEG